MNLSKVIVQSSFGFFTLILVDLIYPYKAAAQLGVGVGLGKISVNEVLTPGGVYKLPNLPVINTGDIEANYNLQVSLTTEYISQFPPSEQKRRSEWFKKWIWFNPQNFTLRPAESKPVNLSLSLPFNAPIGEYLFYLEAAASDPQQKEGNAFIGPAAATKLYFRVGQAPGVLGAFRQRVSTLWNFYQPWSTFLTVSLDLFLVLLLLKSLFSLKVELKPKSKDKALK